MFELPNTPEIHRLALNIGAFVAIAYKDKYGVIPGGIIVPGFIIVLFLISPIWCLTSLVLAFLIFRVYKKFLDQTSYKRRTPMYVLAFLSLPIANAIGLLYIKLGWLYPSLDSLSGTLLPAVIAFTFTKQKIFKVVKAMTITTAIATLILIAVHALGFTVLGLDFDTLEPLYAEKERLKLEYPLLHFYVALAVGYLIYRYKDVRSGGYMVAPIAAALFVKPVSGVIFFIGCFTVYFVVQTICKFTLTIGLKRYAIALFFSTLFVWTVEMLFINYGFDILPFQGSNLFVIIAMMSYVNDSILYSKKNVLSYMSLSILTAIITLFIVKTLIIILGNPEAGAYS